MAANVVINKQDLTREIKRLERLTPRARAILSDEINATAQDIRSESIANINAKGLVDTGTLKNSAQVKQKASPSNLNAEVGVYAKYAPYLEFGTGTTVDVPQGLENYAIQFKGKGVKQINIMPGPYFFPAVFKNRQKFINNVKAALTKLK